MNTLHFIVMTCLLMLATSASAVEQITFYHNDAAGSPIAATDDSGNLLWDQAYDAWGVPIPNPSGDPRGFTGASRDSDTGLSDLQARWYSSELGRMLAMDPVSFHEEDIQSFNFYAYANNNPYRYLDADGRNPTPFSMHLNDTRIRSIAKSDPAFHAQAQAWQAAGTAVVSMGIGMMISPAFATGVLASERAGLIEMPIPVAGIPAPKGAGKSPHINPRDVANKTPGQIDAFAKETGLIPKGPNPQAGKGAYVDPATGNQRVLCHTNCANPHAHVNNPQGQRLDINGKVVPPESPAAHLPINFSR